MDSLQLVGEINTRLTELDNKINKTSKSASVAFSYLYTKINDFNKTDSELENKINYTNERVSYLSNKSDIISSNSYSYFVTLSKNMDNLIVSSVTNNFTSLQDELITLKNEINDIKLKLNDIIKVPEQYLVVKKEVTTFKSIWSNISDFFYKLFHAKKIREEKIALQQKEKERIEIEEKIRKEQEAKRKAEEEKRNAEAKKKIQDLIKK